MYVCMYVYFIIYKKRVCNSFQMCVFFFFSPKDSVSSIAFFCAHTFKIISN